MITKRTRILTVMLSFIVTAAMIAPVSAYADDTGTVIPAGARVEIAYPCSALVNPTDSHTFFSNMPVCFSLVATGYNIDATGFCDFVFQKNESGTWTDVAVIKDNPVRFSFSSSVWINDQNRPASTALSVGVYRLKVIYHGNSYWAPVETDWYNVKIVPQKTTPTPSIDVASGNTSNLNAALTTPTVSFSLKAVDGVTPTGKVAFTLQKKSGSKWKATSKKTVTMSNCKASYKLTKANNAGTYRVQMAYTGDSNYNAVTTKWQTVKIKKGKGTLKKKAKIYKKASTKSKKLTTFKKKKKITITGASGKYFKVSFKLKGKTKTGYIAKKYVKVNS